MKRALLGLMVFVLFCGLFFVSNVQASNEVSGVISSDTTWTKAGSPYTITGKTLISEGVTLTIEPGVTVNMIEDQENPIYIQVNGTLIARGTETERIIFNGGQIKFTQASTSYNEKTGSGSIIENAVITSSIQRCVYIQNSSPKITNNEINGHLALELSSSRIENNKINGLIDAAGGSAIFSGNLITKFGFAVYDPLPDDGKTLLISGNTIFNCDYGVFFYPSETAFDPSCIIIQNNLITNNRIGISNEGMTSTTIRNNTITNNREKGISILDYESSNNLIKFNNFQNNGKYNLFLVQRSTVKGIDATCNWWGTTDIAAINKTIYDSKNDFDLGTVNFIPILSEPNSNAADSPDLPIISPTPTPASTPNPSVEPTTTPTRRNQNDMSAFNIKTNSTISAFAFDANIPQISFIVSGPEGTTGYIELSIAKNMMPNADCIKVYIDGEPINREVTSNDAYWIVTFTYHHSSHQVTINSVALSSTESTSPIWNTLTIAVIVGVAVVVVGMVVLHKRKTPTRIDSPV